MEQQSTPVTRRRRRTLALSLAAILLSAGLCFVLYEYSPVGWVLYFLTAPTFDDRAEALVPEYDRLNDELWESLPRYPRATLLPESQQRAGPGHHPVPPGGPAYPRHLTACFSTGDTLQEVDEFYQKALEQDGWKPNQDTGGFYKGQACVRLNFCSTEFESEFITVYEVAVYHDLNVLLGFPRIPKIIYWLGEVRHCP
jgi:hypothetical protein